MPRSAPSLAVVDAIASSQAGLITARQLTDAGVPRSTTRHRVRTGGPWTRVLPGTYLTSGGRPDRHQQRVAALVYAGPDAVLTGIDALDLLGVWRAPVVTSDPVHVLIPIATRRASAAFVVIERTARRPRTLVRVGLDVAPVARAVVDATRRMRRASDVTALVARAVQGGFATVDQLDAEVRSAHRRSTALVRDALEQVRAGARSNPEAELRTLWLTSGLPEPLWNARLLRPDGRFLASPDAYVASAGVAVEVDSVEFHLAPADWERTMLRHSDMTAHGLVVIHVPPSRIRRAGRALMADIEAAIEARRGRPSARVRVARR